MASVSRTADFLAGLDSVAREVVAAGNPAELVSGRGVVAYARTIWAYSAAAKNLGMKDCLFKAAALKDYFLQHFIDHKWGGVYGSVDACGERVDTDKKTDFIAAAIFGLSEYAAAARDESVAREASALYLSLEQYMHCDGCGAYVELKSRDWQTVLSEGVVLNTLLHVLEAYANLYKVWPDGRLRDSIVSLVRLLADKVQESGSGISYASYNCDWTVADRGYNYGHQLSAGWLMIYAAAVVRDIDLVSEIREKAHLSVRAGFHAGREADGSMKSRQLADGTVVDEKQLWIQGEAIIAALFMWKYNACGHAADKVFQTWESLKAGFPGMNGDLYHTVRLASITGLMMNI